MTTWEEESYEEGKIARAVLTKERITALGNGEAFEVTYRLKDDPKSLNLVVLMRMPNDEKHKFLRAFEEYDFSLSVRHKEEWQE